MVDCYLGRNYCDALYQEVVQILVQHLCHGMRTTRGELALPQLAGQDSAWSAQMCEQRHIEDYKCRSSEGIPISISMLSTLALRNRGNHLDKCPTVSLTTNLFKVDFNDQTKIHIYAVRIEPEVPAKDSRKFRAVMLNSRKSLEKVVGTFALSGRTLFGSKGMPPSKSEFSVKTDFEGTSFKCFLKIVREVAMSDVFSADNRKSGVVYNFLNNLLRNLFHQVGYSQIGRSRKYFSADNFQPLQSTRMTLFRGYSSGFSVLEGGLFLRMDPTFKVVRNKTALQQLNQVYQLHNSLSRQQKRALVNEELIGKMVMTNYGRQAYYVIESVLFDKNPENHKFFNGNTEVTILQYYLDTYGINIEARKQPLLKAVSTIKNKKNDKQILLVPELLLLTGIPDDFDERKRREISQYTIVNPRTKLDELNDIFSSFEQDKEGFNPDSIADNLGIRLSTTPTQIQAKQLNPPELQLGKRGKIDENKATNFMLFDRPLFSSEVQLRIVLLCPEDFNLDQSKSLLASTSRNLGLTYQLKKVPIRFQQSRTAIQNIQQIAQRQARSTGGCNIFWVVLPNNFKNHYGSVKKALLRSEVGVCSQVCLAATFQKKGFPSVFTKVLLQMAAKVGNKLWVPRVSNKVPAAGIMMVGIENYADAQDKNFNVLSYCCNTNRECSSYYSESIRHPKSESAKTHASQIVLNCMSEYMRVNNEPPSDLIIIKNGSSKYDNRTVIDAQVAETKDLLKGILKMQNVRLVYVLLDKDTSQKFFADSGRDILNPRSGMLVNSEAVAKGFEFYLVAQQCNRGTVRPTFYRVVYSDSSLEEGVIEQLLYAQCFNYVNWTGSIKVPAVMQYAKKLSMFVGQHINGSDVSCNLHRNLYFI